LYVVIRQQSSFNLDVDNVVLAYLPVVQLHVAVMAECYYSIFFVNVPTEHVVPVTGTLQDTQFM